MPDADATTVNDAIAKIDPETVESAAAGAVEEKADEPAKPQYDPDWPESPSHGRFTYRDDDLAIRVPTMQALAAFQLSSSKYISSERQNDISGLFVDQHLGPDSYDRVMYRMMSPDDPDYNTKSVAEIMGELVSRAVEKIKADAEAEVEKQKKIAAEAAG